MIRSGHTLTDRLTELAVLSSLGSGASIADVVATIGAEGSFLDAGDVQRLGERLVDDGMLRHDNSDAPTYALTPRGRHAVLALGKECVIAAVDFNERAALLSAEHKQVELLRTDLLSTISHELRTPLTLIRTSVGLLIESEADADEHMRQRLRRNIQQGSDRMQALVTDLLDLARLRSNRLELQFHNVDTRTLVLDAVALMKPIIDQKRQSLEVRIPEPAPVVTGDAQRLERVLLNLLSNATKFAHEGACIVIRIVTEADMVTMHVSDNGPGITPEAMPRLFEQFYTGRMSSSHNNIGAGLGLPIVKGIVEAHGGKIWVESKLGAGSTFSVTLRAAGTGEE